MGEGKPGSNAPHSEAHANVTQATIHDQGQWNTGTPKNPGDAATQGIYTDASDKNAHAGDNTSVAHRKEGEHQPSVPAGQHDANPSTYGSMKDGGRPASGATANADKKVDGEDAFK